jgi:hypothetical protein
LITKYPILVKYTVKGIWALALPKTTNSGYRKTHTGNKAAKLENGDRLFMSSNRLTNAEYHGIASAVSSSALKELYYGKNPQHCYKKYILKTIEHKQSEPMLIGAATHKLILEPKTFHHEFVVWEGGRRAGGEWKAFKEYHSGKDIITKVQYEEIKVMARAVRNHPEANKLLSGGDAEQSVFWRDEETGVLCRARADYIKPNGNSNILIDVKTCVSAEPEKFAKDLINLGYPLQQAMYMDAFKSTAFAFICIEKVTNTVQVYTLDDLFYEAGHFIYRQALEKWAGHLQADHWPVFTGEPIKQLDCPEWWANKILTWD